MHQNHLKYINSILGCAAHLAGSKFQADAAQTQLLAMRSQLEHEKEIFAEASLLDRDRMAHEASTLKIRAEILREVLTALVERRVDALESSFMAILQELAKHARHYMEQQAKYSQAHINETDPLRIAKYQSRITECDLQLAQIRIDAQRLFQDMGKVLTALGGSAIPLVAQQLSTLNLPLRG